ncbi:hypothetical protein CBW46_019485 [Paenibacillus xerothermodurans]|uniref:Uncharacterized protein n=1 Tax=Paenibacillus xerothermodurans TaxID=1977292 RepID=A0A2W1N3H1_PAEXE|nr:hypothetical protein CBW46_019485 [Paenibacillus xerothermodurans]
MGSARCDGKDCDSRLQLSAGTRCAATGHGSVLVPARWAEVPVRCNKRVPPEAYSSALVPPCWAEVYRRSLQLSKGAGTLE